MKQDYKNYKTYAVTIEITAGEYAKYNTILIHAPNEEKAWHYACYCESHNPDRLDWENDRGCAEPDWSFFYHAYSEEEVSATDITILRKHLSYATFNEKELDQSGNYKEQMTKTPQTLQTK